MQNIHYTATTDTEKYLTQPSTVNQDYSYLNETAEEEERFSSELTLENSDITDLELENNIDPYANLAESQRVDYANNPSNVKADWFAVLDENGVEGYIKYGRIGLNKNRELSLNNYRMLNMKNQKIFIPDGCGASLGMDGVIKLIIRSDTQKKKIPIGVLKCLSLTNDEITPRMNSMICDLKIPGSDQKFLKQYDTREMIHQRNLEQKKLNKIKDFEKNNEN